MERNPLVRWGWQIALAAGLAWILPLIVGRLSPDPDSWDCNSSWDYALNALDVVTFFLTGAAVWAVFAVQQSSDRLGALRWAALAATAGAIGAGVNNPIEHCADVEALGLALWVPSIVLLSFGLLVLGGLMLSDRVLPAWVGAAVLVGALGMFLLKEEASSLAQGSSWLVVSLALWRSRSSVEAETLPPD